MEIKDIISGFIEKYLEEWMALPASIRDIIIRSPDKFKFTFQLNKNGPPVITFNRVTFSYSLCGNWEITSIEI